MNSGLIAILGVFTISRVGIEFSTSSSVTNLLYYTILCTISLAISYVSHLFCAHLCAVQSISIAMTRTGS